MRRLMILVAIGVAAIGTGVAFANGGDDTGATAPAAEPSTIERFVQDEQQPQQRGRDCPEEEQRGDSSGERSGAADVSDV